MKFLNEEGLHRVVSWIKSNYINKVSGSNATLSFYKGDKKQDIVINNVAHATSANTATQDKNGLQIDTNYLKLAGGSMQGLLNLFANSTIPTPAAQDKSKQITNTEWVQTWVKAFVAELSNNIEVEKQEDGHFSCPALGITGLMAQNGYICLGKLFGNLILQWGYAKNNNIYTLTFPISFKTAFYIPLAITDTPVTANAENYTCEVGRLTKNGCLFTVYPLKRAIHYLIIGF